MRQDRRAQRDRREQDADAPRAARSRTVTAGLAAACLALTVVVTTASPAGTAAANAPVAGVARGTDAGASTSPVGAHVRIGFDGAYWEQGRGDSGTGGSGSGRGCTRRWVPLRYDHVANPQIIYWDMLAFGPQPSPEHRPFKVWCDNSFVARSWILPTDFAATAGPSAAEIAAEIARDLPYPNITIGVNPTERGLAGLETWLWTEGYDGAPISDSVTGLGATVEVVARAVDARWDFGDGGDESVGTITGGPGAPSARHVYEWRSEPDGFTLVATFEFAVRYRVDGGEWAALAPVIRSASRTYVVADSRSQLVTGPDE